MRGKHSAAYDSLYHNNGQVQRNRCRMMGGGRGGGCSQAECVRALKGLVLPCASHSGEITLSCRLHSTLAAAPALFAHTVVTEVKKSTSATLRGGACIFTSSCMLEVGKATRFTYNLQVLEVR